MSIMMERYLKRAGISTPMGRVLDEAALREDVWQDLAQFISDNGTSKPGAWNDAPVVKTADPEIMAAIKKLPVVTVGQTPMDRFMTGDLKHTRGIGVAFGKTLAYVIDTSGYDYARYVVAVPKSWVK